MAGNVRASIEALGFKCDFITNPNWKAIKKERYSEKKTGHMIVRVDHNDRIERAKDLDKIDWAAYDLVVVVDYQKGFLLEEDLKYIADSAKMSTLDTKKQLGSWANNFNFIKINRKEFEEQRGLSKKLLSNIIVTLGEGGCRYREKTYPVRNVEIKNLCSAGDQFHASFAVKYLELGDVHKALEFANECSTITVQRKAISPVTRKDLLVA